MVTPDDRIDPVVTGKSFKKKRQQKYANLQQKKISFYDVRRIHCGIKSNNLKGVFAKNERGYKLTSKNIRG